LALAFSNGTTVIRFDAWAQFALEIGVYLTSFLTNYPDFFYEPLPSETADGPIKTKHRQIVNLFLSQAYLTNRRLDEKQFFKFAKSLKHSNLLTIDASQGFTASLVPLVDVVMYATEITAIQFGGRAFNDIWRRTGDIIEANLTIQKIEIFDVKTSKEFETFMTKVSNGKVVSELSFRNVIFKDTAKIISANLPKTPVTELRFCNCQFAAQLLPEVVRHPGCFSQLKKLSISGDPIPPKSIHDLVASVSGTPIEVLAIQDAQLDLHQFFWQLSDRASTLELTAIDLSANTCPAAYTGSATFPKKLTRLTLRRVTWEGRSLVDILSRQTFLSDLAVDFSEAGLTEAQAVRLFQDLPQQPRAPQYRGLKWESNFLSVQLIAFFAKLTHLRTFSIANCTIPRAERAAIVPVRVTFIGSMQLTSLNVSRALAPIRGWLPELKVVLAGHNTLAKLDVSFNPVGYEGAGVLVDVMRTNTNLVKVAFDGIELASAQELQRVLDAIAGLQYIPHIQRPSREIERLTAKAGHRIVNDTRAAWEKIKSRMAAPRRPGRGNDSTSDAPPTSDTTSVSLVSVAPHIEATWDVQIDIPGIRTMAEWKELRTCFTYEAITGIAVGGSGSQAGLEDDPV
jgi:hypothetical protein